MCTNLYNILLKNIKTEEVENMSNNDLSNKIKLATVKEHEIIVLLLIEYYYNNFNEKDLSKISGITIEEKTIKIDLNKITKYCLIILKKFFYYKDKINLLDG